MANEANSEVNESAGKLDRKAMLRQWTILNRLDTDGPGFTYKELATEFDTDVRTIGRDIRLFQDLGFPLVSTNLPRGEKQWRRPAGLIPSINLSLTDAVSLYLSRRLLEPLAGTELWGATQQVFEKFRCSFDNKMLTYLDKLAQIFHCTRFGTRDYSAYNTILNNLLTAIRQRQVTTLSYQSQNTTEPAERDVHPYHLVYHRSALYLVAWAVDHQAFRNYKVDRISSVIIESERPQRKKQKEQQRPISFEPIQFDLQEYLAGSFGIYQGARAPTNVRIRFQKQVVRYIQEKFWHESAVSTPQPDGSLIVEFTLTSFEEVKSWILSFGPQAQVLEPAELITEIREDLKQMTAHYRVEDPSVLEKAIRPAKA